MQRLRHLLIGGLLVVGYFAGLPPHAWQPAPSFAVPAAATVAPDETASWRALAASDADTPLVHAAAAAELPDGRLQAVWFAGSREGAGDVAIHGAVFDPASGQWSDERVLVDRPQLMAGLGLYVRKLGNAVLHVDADGRMRMFVVAVSFGGWGASRIAVIESADGGVTWESPMLLQTSPFLNISYLVKGAPISYDDGSIGLPVYHELAGKFGELLRIDADNRVLSRARIGHGRAAIQPSIIVTGAQQATAFLRNTRDQRDDGIWRSDSEDAGRHWSPLRGTGEPNPNAAVSALALDAQHWLLAANCNARFRDDLCLKVTQDAGQHWQLLTMFHDRTALRALSPDSDLLKARLGEELAQTDGVDDAAAVLARAERNKCRDDSCEFQYDYPFMLRTRNGDVHILYTWNKSLVRHYWWPANGEAR